MEVATLLNEVVDSMVLTLNVYAVRLSSSKYKCYTLNTHYLNTNKVVSIGGYNYRVDSFSLNEWVLLEPVGHSEAIVEGDYNLPNPFFIWGKYKAVNQELAKQQFTSIMPLIWMFELQPRAIPQDKLTVIESSGSVRLFFMSTANYTDFTTSQHYTEVIYPMDNLITSFFAKVKRHKRVGNEVFLSSRLNHSKFTTGGGSISGGQENNVLGKELSGVELEIQIPIKIDLNCPVKTIPAIAGGAFDSSFDNSFDRS